MNFDRMGRRTFYKEEVNGVVTKHHRFVYDNYLCVQKVDALNNNSQINLFVWDPTEPVATRPLFTQRGTGYKFFYTCDGNKNVSELVHFEARNGIAAHYDYAPFGAVTRAISVSAVTDNTFTTDNPFRFPSPGGLGRIFSSEYHDDTLGLVYYRERERIFHGHYRHYNPIDGRWCGRDPLEEQGLYNLFQYGKKSFIVDYLGCSLLREVSDSLMVLGQGAMAVGDGIYYIGKIVQTHAGAMFLIPTSILDGEFLNEIKAGDFGRVLDFSQNKGCRFNISVNGMANEDGSGLADLVQKKIKQNVHAFDNPHNLVIPYADGLGVGDLAQSLFYEMGLMDIAVASLAKSLEQAKKQGDRNGCDDVCIVIYAHSQGTMLTRRAFDMLKYMYGADHSVLSKITFCGYGRETSIDAEEFGLRATENVLNAGDGLRFWPRRWLDPTIGDEDNEHPYIYYFPEMCGE